MEGRTSINVQFMFVDLGVGAKDQSSLVISRSQRSGHRPARLEIVHLVEKGLMVTGGKTLARLSDYERMHIKEGRSRAYARKGRGRKGKNPNYG